MKLETKWRIINKVNEASLFIVMLALVLVYSCGIILRMEVAFWVGLLGVMAYIPFWCWLTDALDKRERYERERLWEIQSNINH